LDPEGFVVVTVAARIMQLVYIIAAKDGWTAELRVLFDRMCRAYGIWAQEYFGLKQRQLSHEIADHALDDLIRHGSVNAVWCWPMERFIKTLGGLTLNGKEIETTMTMKVLLGMISSVMNMRREEASLEAAGLQSGNKLWKLVRECYEENLVI
jgi:hypothetical protein